MKEIIADLNKLDRTLEQFKELIAIFVKNKKVPLEDRWTVLIHPTAEKLGNTSWRTDFGLPYNDEFLYEGPLYLNKSETQSVESILTALLEGTQSPNLTEEDIITFKEYCCKEFYTHMVFDW